MTIFKRISSVFWVATPVSLFLFFSGSPAAQALIVAPNHFQPTLSTEDVLVKKIDITNETTTDQVYQVSVAPFSLDVNGNLNLNSGSTTAVPWLVTDQTQLSVPAGQSTELTVTLSVPVEAVSGVYPTAVVITPVEGSAEVKTVSRFFITVKGNLHTAAEIPTLTTPQSVYSPDDQVPFHVEFKNTGTTDITPIGQIDLYRGADLVGQISLNDTNDVVLPGTVRNFAVTWNSSLGFGKYTAKVTLNGENDLSVQSPAVSFWVLSWERILPVVVLLIIFLITASVLLRHPSKE